MTIKINLIYLSHACVYPSYPNVQFWLSAQKEIYFKLFSSSSTKGNMTNQRCNSIGLIRINEI